MPHTLPGIGANAGQMVAGEEPFSLSFTDQKSVDADSATQKGVRPVERTVV